MKIIETTSGLEKLAKMEKGCVLTIGNFDGVHLGHQEIINIARKLADQRNSELVLMTFEPHPVAILNPEKAPSVLTPMILKKHLLARLGVDCMVILESSYRILNLSPESFVDEFLQKSSKPAIVVEGEDFNFGYGRSGKINQNTRIATISIGYADGFLRKAGNGNYEVLIQGKKAPTIGNVCMDMTMVDISNIPEAIEGGEVIIFSKDLPVEVLASCIETIPYEVFTNLSERIKRVYFQD